MCDYKDVCKDYNPMCDADVGETDPYPGCLNQYSQHDVVVIKHWAQETAESGGWRYTKPMERNVASSLIESLIFERAEIIDK